MYKNYDRQCCLNDFLYINNCDVEEIIYDNNQQFKGIKTTTGKYIYGSILISEPTYMEKFKKVQIKGKIIRRICILNHPIPGTGECDSCQIIIPQNQINGKNDIFILQLGYGHCVCKKGYYVVFISSFIDSNNINKQLAPAMEIIGNTLECFDKIYSFYEPINKTFNDNIFISNSFLPQSHFENDFDEDFEVDDDDEFEINKNPVKILEKLQKNIEAVNLQRKCIEIKDLIVNSFSKQISNYTYINNINNILRCTVIGDIALNYNKLDINHIKDYTIKDDINNIKNKIIIKNLVYGNSCQIWCMKKLNDIKINENKKLNLIALGSSSSEIILINLLNFKIHQLML